MANAEPYRPLPFVAAGNAALLPDNLAVAAARSSEASRAPDVWRVTRDLLQLRGQVQRAVAWTLAQAPFGALNEVVGTTVRPQQLAANRSPHLLRGHLAPVAHKSFGLPGAVGMAATHCCATAVGSLFGAVGLGQLAHDVAHYGGRFVTGVVCGVLAGSALLLKLAAAAATTAVVVAVGLGRIALELVLGRPATVALATASPEVDASWRWRAQDSLTTMLDAELEAHEASREALGRQAIAQLQATGAWTTSVGAIAAGSPGGPSASAADEAGRVAQVAALCGLQPAGKLAPLDEKVPGQAATQAPDTADGRWAQHVTQLSDPTTLLRLLQGCSAEVGQVPLDLPALLASAPSPRATTQLTAVAPPQGPRAVRVDTLLSWPRGALVAAADARPVRLNEALAIVVTLRVDRPYGSQTAGPVACVEEARLLVGQVALDQLGPPVGQRTATSPSGQASI